MIRATLGGYTQNQRAAWAHGDDGSVTAETTLVTPILVMLLVLTGIFIHRGVDARIRIDDAANQAARAASIQRTTTQAHAAAQTIAAAALSSAGLACQSVNVDTTTDDFRPGGSVRVVVSCDVDFGDALLLVVPDSQRLSASAAAPIDMWRSTRSTP